MKRYAFRLERVLAVRRAQAGAERLALEQLQQRQNQVRDQRARLRSQAETQVRALAAPGADHPASHLHSVQQFAGFVRAEDVRLASALAALEQELAQQRWRLQQAEQRCRLLEKLEEKQRADWEAAAEKENEELAADVFLAQWSRPAGKLSRS